MAVQNELTPFGATDRLAILELFDAYAIAPTAATPRDRGPSSRGTLRFAVFIDGEGEPTYALVGRKPLTPVFDDLNRYEATTHLNGQSKVASDRNRATNRATGESYRIAQHAFNDSDRGAAWSGTTTCVARAASVT